MSETNTFSLPVEIDGITRDWLETALSGYAPGVRVRDFELVDFIRTTCTKIRIRLDLDNNPPDAPIPPTVILKGGFEPHSRKMWPMHQNEALSYGTLMPQLGLRVPTPYFSGWDEDALQGIVIMEDLVARGVHFCSPLEPHSFEHTEKRVKALARFHAQTWGSPEIRAGGRWGWLSDMPANWHAYFDPYLEPEVWNHYVTSARAPRPPPNSTTATGCMTRWTAWRPSQRRCPTAPITGIRISATSMSTWTGSPASSTASPVPRRA